MRRLQAFRSVCWLLASAWLVVSPVNHSLAHAPEASIVCGCRVKDVQSGVMETTAADQPPRTHDPTMEPPSTDHPARAHDPTMAKEGETYYFYTTGPGIPFSSSKDRKEWTPRGKAFTEPMPWTASTVPGSRDIYWAPDIVRYRGRWLLFYAVSTFGRNRSAIGLATNATLDPDSKDYLWKDAGIVVETHSGDNWNAIDPSFAVDASGQPWLAVGSFWSGIKLIRLDRKTCKPMSDEPEVRSIAQRPNTPEIRGAIEAPFLLHRGKWYYLFASFDFCCRGVKSTYNVRVGRASEITGPYLDRDGRPMMEGGGTQVLFPTDRWKGPGHNSILHDGRTDLIVYHAYDAQDNGTPRLRIEKLAWDAEGWPIVR